MLVVTSDDVSKFHEALKRLSPEALPHAARGSMNAMAFHARNAWSEEGRRTMTVRNQWTFGGRHHRVVEARFEKHIASMEAEVGNKHRYMLEQEYGVARGAGFRKGIPIPTTKSRISRMKTRLVRRAYWRNAIKLGKRMKPGNFNTMEQYVAASVAAAKRRGMEFAYLDFGRKRGIYDVSTKSKTKMVWNMSKTHAYTKPNPMLQRTLKTIQPDNMLYARQALEYQIGRQLKARGIRVRGPSAFAAIPPELLR